MPLLSILLAFIGYSMMYIASACQKIGLAKIKRNRVQGRIIWVTATVFTSVSSFVVLSAVTLGNVSVVGSMAGVGLASLVVFSALVMKEKTRKRELLGVFVILCSAALVTAFAKADSSPQIIVEALYISAALVTAVFVLLWVVFRKRKKVLGVLIGAFSGSLSGFEPIFKKVSTSAIGRASSVVSSFGAVAEGLFPAQGTIIRFLEEIFLNPFALTWVFFSIVSMVIIQFAYKHDKVISILPVFTANYITIPVILGVLFFRETLHPFQWAGIVMIIVGVFLVTWSKDALHPKVTEKERVSDERA